MIYVVVYDISDDRLRLSVSRVLEGYGERVQESVFQCRLTPPRLERLTKRLVGLLGSPDRGDIRVYRVCADCLADSFGLGEVATTLEERSCIIL